jgi:hypothetical protein
MGESGCCEFNVHICQLNSAFSTSKFLPLQGYKQEASYTRSDNCNRSATLTIFCLFLFVPLSFHPFKYRNFASQRKRFYRFLHLPTMYFRPNANKMLTKGFPNTLLEGLPGLHKIVQRAHSAFHFASQRR